MSNIIVQLGIKFKSTINPNNTIIKYADGERRITTLLSMLPLIEDVDELIILVDESINNIPLVSPLLSIDFVSCEIDPMGVKIWDHKDYSCGPYESYTLQEFKSVLLLWKEFLQKPPLYGTMVK